MRTEVSPSAIKQTARASPPPRERDPYEEDHQEAWAREEQQVRRVFGYNRWLIHP